MPVESPFHERMLPLMQSYRWKDWGGIATPCSYEPDHIYEYTAFRQSAGAIDVTPLYKYEVNGDGAAAFLARVMAKDITKLKVGRATYVCWCDKDGKIVDDGTVSRLEETKFLVTAAEPSFHWFKRLSRGFDVELEDVSRKIAALALQGPTSRDILKQCCDADMDNLKFFQTTKAKLDGADVQVSRTGYTGDLGYEIWSSNADALKVWDAVMDAGQNYDIRPAGMDALDVTRIEAGFVMAGVDFFSAPHEFIEAKKSTPFEIGLGWTVKVDRGPFMGQQALRREVENGSVWQLVGLELSWEEIEALYNSYGLPPSLSPHASREALPVYLEGEQVGQVTSSTWSPILKKQVALATVRTFASAKGTQLQVEHTALYERRTVKATVVDTPFYDPPHKRKP